MLYSFRELFRICKPQKEVYFLSVLCSFLATLSNVLAYYFIYSVCKNLLDNIPIKIYVIGIGISFLLYFLLSGISSMISHNATAKLLCKQRKKIIKKMNLISFGELKNHQNGYYKKLVVDDVEGLEKFLAHSIPEVAGSVGVTIFVVIVLFIVDWRLAICTIATIPLGFFVLSRMMLGAESKMENYSNSLEAMNSSLIEYITGMSVIKAFHKEGDMSKNLNEAIENFRYYVVDWYSDCWKYLAGFSILMKANILILIPVSGVLFINEMISLEKIIFVLLLSFTFTVPMTKLMEFADTMPMISENFLGIEEFLRTKELEQKKEFVKVDNYDIEFKNVSFSYDNTEKYAVNNLNFKVKEGQIKALVGASGSGKSTTASLAARFFDVNKGEITIADIPIKNIPLEQLMEMVSFVFQESFIINGTLEENIRMGKKDVTEKEILEAAKKARCEDILKEKGLNSISELSGGQKQRIALCRAILKDAPILILDEATASLDMENQSQIQEAISELAKNKTVIVIAHRLSTIIDSDEILVFKEGSIVEKGRHNKLLEQKGVYEKLYSNYIKALNFKMKKQEEK